MSIQFIDIQKILLLYNNSKCKYPYDKALQLKTLAKESIVFDDSAIELQIQCLIKQLKLYQNSNIKYWPKYYVLIDLLNPPIINIPGVDYTLGAMIISKIGVIKIPRVL